MSLKGHKEVRGQIFKMFQLKLKLIDNDLYDILSI